MKKNILLLVFFLNLLPAVRNSHIVLIGPMTTWAQDTFGDEEEGPELPPHPPVPPEPPCTVTTFETKALDTVADVIEITETCGITSICGGAETGRDCHYGSRIKEGFPEPPENELPGFPSEGTPESPAIPGGSGVYPFRLYGANSGSFSLEPTASYVGTTTADRFHGTGSYIIHALDLHRLNVTINLLVKLPDNYPLWAEPWQQMGGTIVDNATGTVLGNVSASMGWHFGPPLQRLPYDKTMATIESEDIIELPEGISLRNSRGITVNMNFGMFNGNSIGCIGYYTLLAVTAPVF